MEEGANVPGVHDEGLAANEGMGSPAPTILSPAAALHQAVQRGDRATVQQLLEQGAPVHLSTLLAAELLYMAGAPSPPGFTTVLIFPSSDDLEPPMARGEHCTSLDLHALLVGKACVCQPVTLQATSAALIPSHSSMSLMIAGSVERHQETEAAEGVPRILLDLLKHGCPEVPTGADGRFVMYDLDLGWPCPFATISRHCMLSCDMVSAAGAFGVTACICSVNSQGPAASSCSQGSQSSVRFLSGLHNFFANASTCSGCILPFSYPTHALLAHAPTAHTRRAVWDLQESASEGIRQRVFLMLRALLAAGYRPTVFSRCVRSFEYEVVMYNPQEGEDPWDPIPVLENYCPFEELMEKGNWLGKRHANCSSRSVCVCVCVCVLSRLSCCSHHGRLEVTYHNPCYG